jgi:hypothetical protein
MIIMEAGQPVKDCMEREVSKAKVIKVKIMNNK